MRSGHRYDSDNRQSQQPRQEVNFRTFRTNRYNRPGTSRSFDNTPMSVQRFEVNVPGCTITHVKTAALGEHEFRCGRKRFSLGKSQRNIGPDRRRLPVLSALSLTKGLG